jgi:glyoxylase-like metal-dependent hydrolase (beta-lactamase superfamily II)
MNISHVNGGSMRPVTPDPESPDLKPERAVAHVLLVETACEGLVLVDTGIGSGDIARPQMSLGDVFLERSQPVLDLDETAARQVAFLGYDASDVRHIVLTHLDLDHAGGLVDFPAAQVHVSETELRAASAPGFHPEDHHRYRPLQWIHQPRWAPFRHFRGASWFGFDRLEQPDGLPVEIGLIPLPGHSAGHVGVAVKDERRGRWLLHAGDSYYYHEELNPAAPRGTPGLDFLQSITEVDRERRLGTVARLRDLVHRHSDEVDVFCAHDPWELLRFQSG